MPGTTQGGGIEPLEPRSSPSPQVLDTLKVQAQKPPPGLPHRVLRSHLPDGPTLRFLPLPQSPPPDAAGAHSNPSGAVSSRLKPQGRRSGRRLPLRCWVPSPNTGLTPRAQGILPRRTPVVTENQGTAAETRRCGSRGLARGLQVPDSGLLREGQSDRKHLLARTSVPPPPWPKVLLHTGWRGLLKGGSGRPREGRREDLWFVPSPVSLRSSSRAFRSIRTRGSHPQGPQGLLGNPVLSTQDPLPVGGGSLPGRLCGPGCEGNFLWGQGPPADVCC